MRLLQRVLIKFNGLKYSQEYLCLAKEHFASPLYVYLLNTDNIVLKDITLHHLFIGYNPLVLTIFENSASTLQGQTLITIVFSTQIHEPSKPVSKKNIIATLLLERLNQFAVDNNTVYYLKGMKGRHYFQHPFHKYIFRLNNRLFNNKNGNVYLKDNLYEQVQIAYAIPRKICLITVEIDGKYNLFPTDLHGAMDGHYIISLRKDGKACRQVETAGKILLCDMDVTAYKTVYALGKNHMQEPKEEAEFNFSGRVSEKLALPIPQNTILYKELLLESSEVRGIHKLLVFKIAHSQKLTDAPGTLAHIHNCYATWRHKHKMRTDYLLR